MNKEQPKKKQHTQRPNQMNLSSILYLRTIYTLSEYTYNTTVGFEIATRGLLKELGAVIIATIKSDGSVDADSRKTLL